MLKIDIVTKFLYLLPRLPVDDAEETMPNTPRRRSSRVAKAQDTSKDVANCFGFDEEEDDDEDEDDK